MLLLSSDREVDVKRRWVGEETVRVVLICFLGR